jgi:hypothetical protein
VVEDSSDRRFAWTAAPLVLAVALLLALTLGSSAASAQPVGAPIKVYAAVPSTTQAGAHPDLTVDFIVGTRQEEPRLECGCNQIKNAMVETPTGFIGNPHAVPECTASQFALDECSADSQVGIALPYIAIGDGCCFEQNIAPIYNLTPQPGQAGLLAWKAPIAGFPIYIVISARTNSDYGLNAEVKGITANFALGRYHQVLWGVPASPIHESQRFKKGGGFAGYNPEWTPPAASNSPEKPFLSNPTTCTGPLTSNLITTAYDHGRHEQTAPWPATSGCDQLNFNPSLAAKPSTEDADSASGLDVALKVPQNDSPATPSDSEIKATTVTLPPGFSINSSAADGKTSCSDTQARFGTTEEAQCPEFAKVGTLSLDSWALPEPIPGGLYLGQPLPGNRYRLFITADGFGTHVKLAGTVHPDPNTGQLTVTFVNLPQSPLTEFDMHFFGSERGLLATPTRCGTYAVNSEFEPWASGLPNQTSTQFFTIDAGPGGSPCPGASRPFNPGFRAAGVSNGAGAHSPFSIYLTRQDGDQTLSTVGVKTPPGFTATLKGIPYCPDSTLREIEASSYGGVAELASPKCPAASQVGESWAGAGAGAKPFYAPGRVYLTGPYKGAPLSFTVVTPAVSGPYDLGNVVNRVAVNVDPATAAVTAVSDPLPQIIEGIPLRLRSVLINLDRRDFILNPTNCGPFSVTGLLTGDQGVGAGPSSHFQVANCDTLGFEPKLRMVLSGATKRADDPALKATLTQPAGQANISRAVVSLPHSEFLDQAHIGNVCTRVQFAAEQCPGRAVYGRARVVTPILDQPLEGPVYLRSNPEHELPDLVAALHGPASQPIEIELAGRIDSHDGGIRTTFAAVPDAPVSKFVLEMKGGNKGLLTNSTDICRQKHFVDARILGQNGARANQRPELEAPCGKGAGKRSKAAKKGRRHR